MPNCPAPLDRLLAVLKTPALAADLTQQIDLWSEIKRLAEIHRFSGWLAHATGMWLPASERQWRDRVLMTHHRRHQQFSRQLRILAEAFRAQGIPCIALKGPLFAERLHPVPFLKLSHDLDLLVPASDIPAATRLVESLNFKMNPGYPWALERKYSHHLNFTGTGDVRTLELHYSLKAGPHHLEGEEFVRRAVNWRAPDGRDYLILAPADEVFYLIIHAAGHAFQRLRWLYDALIAAKALDADRKARVRSLALEMGLTGYFVAADMACREFFGEGLPLDLSGFGKPWLWSPLNTKHIRGMAQREDYGFGIRTLDVCRMSGSPVSAVRLCLQSGSGKLPVWLYRLRNGG